MNEEDKIAWIDEENKIVSFHAIDDGKMIIKAESLFWDFLFGLPNSPISLSPLSPIYIGFSSM